MKFFFSKVFVHQIMKGNSLYLVNGAFGLLQWVRKSVNALIITMVVGAGSLAVAEDTVHDLILPSSDAEIDLGDYKGKLLYIDFWASWCAPCLQSFPWMNEMQTKYADQGLQIVAINLDKKKDLTKAFLKKTQPLFPIAFDPNGDFAQQFNVIGMPNSFIFGGDGNLISSHVGFRLKDLQKYEATLVAALATLADQ